MISLSTEELAQQQGLLAAHRDRLAVYLRQIAIHDPAYAPPAIVNGIDEARGEIARIKAVLRDAGVRVADRVDDAPNSVLPASRLPQKERRNRQAMIEKVRLTWSFWLQVVAPRAPAVLY